MAETITRLPFDPTPKQLAAGIFEISALLGLGGAVGPVAPFAHMTVEMVRARLQVSGWGHSRLHRAQADPAHTTGHSERHLRAEGGRQISLLPLGKRDPFVSR